MNDSTSSDVRMPTPAFALEDALAEVARLREESERRLQGMKEAEASLRADELPTGYRDLWSAAEFRMRELGRLREENAALREDADRIATEKLEQMAIADALRADLAAAQKRIEELKCELKEISTSAREVRPYDGTQLDENLQGIIAICQRETK